MLALLFVLEILNHKEHFKSDDEKARYLSHFFEKGLLVDLVTLEDHSIYRFKDNSSAVSSSGKITVIGKFKGPPPPLADGLVIIALGAKHGK